MADQGQEGLLSPFLRAKRIAAVRPHLRGRVLDVGCGSGALAAFVDSARYVGLEPDSASIAAARARHPDHRFVQGTALSGEYFDTIVTLAVIEHLGDPVAFLGQLAGNLAPNAEARLLCTTPHPALDWAHDVGARIGLFSHSANEEHEELLGRQRLADAGRAAGLEVVTYRRFLLGANQLCVYRARSPAK